jgi:hypothetical protein
MGLTLLISKESVMERLLVKQFVKFLEGSSDETLTTRRELCVKQLSNPNVKSLETRKDIGLCIRLIDEEISARLEVFGIHQKQA